MSKIADGVETRVVLQNGQAAMYLEVHDAERGITARRVLDIDAVIKLADACYRTQCAQRIPEKRRRGRGAW